MRICSVAAADLDAIHELLPINGRSRRVGTTHGLGQPVSASRGAAMERTRQ